MACLLYLAAWGAVHAATLEATVTDAASGRPVPGATVNAGGTTQVTAAGPHPAA